MSVHSIAILLVALASHATSLVAVQALESNSAATQLDAATRHERQDLGVAATRHLHAGAMHGPTPASIPGGQVITTAGLVALIQGRQAPFVVFDVLGGGEALPNALPAPWLAQAGAFDDAVQQQAAQLFAQRTQGRKDVALVFYCLSRECWLSYNAALRAVAAGYGNVLWYRGGIEAWKAAGLPTQAAGQAGFAPAPAAQQAQQAATLPQGKFVSVQPVARQPAATPARPPAELRIAQTRFFSFALPPGWRVGEDGQFALTLVAPDSRALTVMVGNAGMPPRHPAARFAFDKLSAMQMQNLQLGAPRPAAPGAGFAQAVEFDVAYSLRGVAWRGVAKVSVAPAYDTQTMAMTAALASADRWPDHAAWLPQVAGQVAATNGGAFGARGVMQQNLQNSMAYAEAARTYRDWSQKNWQQVTDDRNASQDRRNFAVRENLGGVQTFANPYATGQSVELPMTHKYYWVDRQGQMKGTDDPRADPNVGSTGDWRRMERVDR
ncbi:MAG: rhodanese-like domain-containing protein [Burkholderiales bacterium]|nr:rhodanese-like domain-containing protein [Burkholderiales bacterium]